MLPVAAALGQGAALRVVDYRRQRKRSDPAGADGLCTITLDPVEAGFLWLVDRMVIATTSATPTECYAYSGDPDLSRIEDGSSHGNFDVADESSPVLVDSAESLTVQWTGASLGAVAYLSVQYQLVQRVTG